MKEIAAIIILMLLLFSCSSSPGTVDKQLSIAPKDILLEAPPTDDLDEYEDPFIECADTDQDYDEITDESDLLAHIAIPEEDYDRIICIDELNINFINHIKEQFSYKNEDKLNAAIHFLAFSNKDFTQAAIQRSEPFYGIVRDVFESAGIPPKIGIGLVTIESAWKTRAFSRARAAGLFQFIPTTGRRYGLRRTSHVEERYHVKKAARASAEYLNNLYNIFNDWKLALAAYNAGEGRVFRAMVNTGYTSDWHDLESGNILARETRDYVSKILAAIIIFENPEAYSLEPVSYNNPGIVEVEIKQAFSPRGLSSHLNMGLEHFKMLNPHLLNDNWIIPPAEFTILVPFENQNFVASYFSDRDIYSRDQQRYATHYSYDGDYKVITIRRGMTLSTIARQYNTTVNTLMHINNLRSTNIIAGRRLKVPAPRHYHAASQEPQVVGEKDGYLVIRIERGMTLSTIARQYNTSTNELMRINNLRSSRIIAGRTLMVPGTGQRAASSIQPTGQAGESGQFVTIRIQRGMTLYDLAREYGTSVAELRRINNLRSNRIIAGQTLKVPGPNT